MRFISTRANILKIIYFLLILVGLPAFGLQVALAQDDKGSLTIGSGGVTGVYYPVAGAICRLFNDSQDAKRSRCSAVSTGGSVDNLTRLRRGELSFGVVQSDWQWAFGLCPTYWPAKLYWELADDDRVVLPTLAIGVAKMGEAMAELDEAVRVHAKGLSELVFQEKRRYACARELDERLNSGRLARRRPKFERCESRAAWLPRAPRRSYAAALSPFL